MHVHLDDVQNDDYDDDGRGGGGASASLSISLTKQTPLRLDFVHPAERGRQTNEQLELPCLLK